MLLVLVEGHDAEVVRGGELDDVGEGDADVLLGDEGAEGLAQLLEDLRVALEQRDAWLGLGLGLELGLGLGLRSAISSQYAW